MSITKSTVVILCHTEQHATHVFFAIDNVQHTASLEHFEMNKKQHVLKHKQYSLIEQYVTMKI